MEKLLDQNKPLDKYTVKDLILLNTFFNYKN